MDDSDPKPRTHHRSIRWLIAAAAVLLLYALAGFLLVPRLARHYLLQYVQQDLHRQASVGQIKFNPFAFTVEIHQFSLMEADQKPIASFELLRVGASVSASLWHRAWTLSEVRLEQPSVQVLIERDGSLNLAKLAPPEPQKSPPPPSSALPAVRIGSLGVHGGRVKFEDLSRSEPFAATLTPIEFDLTDFRTAPQFQNKYSFSAQSSAGERLDWAGQFTVRPLGSSGEFTLTAIKASTIASYLQGALPFALTGGSLDVLGSYQFTASPATVLSLTLPSIKVHTLGVAPAESGGKRTEGTPWISLPELELANTSVAMAERRVSIGQISVQRPAVQVWRNADGSLNLQQLLAKAPDVAEAKSPAPTPAAPNSAAAPWSIALNRLELQDGRIEAEDRSITPAFKLALADIGLTVQDYSSTGSAPIKLDLHLKLGETGQLRTQGTVALSSLDSALDFDLSGLDLPGLQPYVAQYTDLTIYRGRLGLKGHVAYAGAPARAQPRMQLSLAVDLTDLATRDNLLNEDLVSARSLRIEGLKYQMSPDALRIDKISANAPYGRVVIGPQGGLNVADILKPARAQQGAAAQPEAEAPKPAKTKSKSKAPPTATVAARPEPASMPMRIARIDIIDGTANFTDHSVMPNFSTAIYGLKGSVTGLSSDPASRATVSLDGSVDRYAPVSIKGEINVLSAQTFTDIAMSFSNIDLPTFNPYSGKFAGYNIAQGKLSTTMKYHVENRKLDAQHHIVIDQLEFGEATESKQAVPLPIKLAVSLLKDRNGVIDLELPVGGSLDDPTFRIAPIVWKVFVNLITKAVTAPFALLGRLIGGGPELSYIDFPAGVSALSDAQVQKLSKLSDALIQRPQLKLDIPLHTQGDDDDAALERNALSSALEGAAPAPASAKRTRTPKPGAATAVAATPAAAATPAGAATPADAATPAAASAPSAAAAAVGAEQLPKLAALYRQQFKSDPDYPPETASSANPDADRALWLQQQLLPQFAPSAAQRDALGLARAQAVQSAVLGNTALKPERVFLTNQVSGGGPDGSVRMNLKLE